MGIEKVSSTPLRMGPEPIPAAHGDFGQLGGFFLAEAATIGHALVRSLSNDDTLVPPASSARAFLTASQPADFAKKASVNSVKLIEATVPDTAG